MTHAAILSKASMVPGESHSSAEMFEFMYPYVSDDLLDTLNQLGVSKRHSIVGNYSQYLVKQTGRKLIETTTSMATKAAKECLEKFDHPSNEIGLLIALTNTADRPLPCLGCELITSLKGLIPNDINILNMQNEGCAALLKGIDVAEDYLSNHPEKYVLIVTSESNTGYFAPIDSDSNHPYYSFRELKKLHSDPQEIRRTLHFISQFLFGDGAIAFILGNNPSSQQSFESITHLTNLNSHDSELLTLNEGGAIEPSHLGFPYYYMDKKVPVRGAVYAKTTTDQLLQRSNSPIKHPNDADICFIHTGSKKILDRVCEVLGIDSHSEKVSYSYEILNEYGNLSSCSIGFMIENYLNQLESQQSLEAPKVGIIVSFGVGFSGSAGIMKL